MAAMPRNGTRVWRSPANGSLAVSSHSAPKTAAVTIGGGASRSQVAYNEKRTHQA